MEEHSPVDISIRSVDVRLNDSNIVGSEMNGECVNSLYIATSGLNEPQVKTFNENFEEKCSSHSDISDEVREKLHVCRDSTDNCGLLNGCSKFIRDDRKCVDFSVNGVNKCSSFELINAHLKYRTCVGQHGARSEIKRTENESIGNDVRASNDDTNCSFSVEKPASDTNCSKALDAKCSVNNSENEGKCCETLSDLNVEKDVNITYLGYNSEKQMPDIMRLIQKDLSEPYSIYTYRYFIHNWPKLCFLAQDGDRCVGAIVCKLDIHKKHSRRGYIAMLAVDEKYRKRKIGSNLVLKAIHAMVQDNADEVVLETEITNKPALRLYENLGFVRDKRLFRYYLNGVDALRLKLWLR